MRRTIKLGIASAGTCALIIGAAAPAFADYAPSAKDVVGVGSDTVQNMVDFTADGDPFGDGGGYNGVGNKYKMVSFDATPDANDRAGYLNNSSASSLQALNPTILLRQQTTPVQRPNGSGSGIAALIADVPTTKYPHGEINFVRASRPLKGSEEQAFVTANPGDQLDTVKISDDPLEIAYSIPTANPLGHTNPASNLPAGAGFTLNQLKGIYLCQTGFRTWHDIFGGSASSDDIVPLLPQVGSGTHDTFLTDLYGSKSAPVGSCVQFVEENDPSAIASAVEPPNAGGTGVTVPPNGQPAAADAIAPFSAGRLALWNGVTPAGSPQNPGYFHDPTVAYPGSATPLSPGIALIQGVDVAANDIYNDDRGLYIIFRNSDLSDPGWQPGSTVNWAKALFWGASSYYGNGFADPYTVAAGGLPDYVQENVGFTVGT
jgi:ABC-type phosphate transport system substrate-binding protein